MKKFDVKVSLGKCNMAINFPVYVRELTDIMQMRIHRKNGEPFTLFECGIDFYSGLWWSTCGVAGRNIQEFVENYFRLVYSGKPDIKYILICDDPIHEDRENESVNGEIAWKATDVFEVDWYDE